MPQDIDPKVKKLVSAIAQTETGQASPEAYTKRGASGEYGRYQFMPETWDRYSKEAGINKPLEQATIEDQNKVAYNKIKSLKDRGYTPAQIASIWNAGEGEPDAYKGTFSHGKPSRGVNSKGVQYDVPAYARKVSAAYLGSVGGTYAPPPAPQPFEAPQTTGLENLQKNLGVKPEGFTGQLAQDLKDVGTGINQASTKSLTGEINPVSGVLQGAGAIAGGLGNVVDTTISNIPVVGDVYKGVNDVIGGAVQGVAQTGPGQALVKGFNSLSPETQGNIGATGNILSVIPFFKAFGSGKKGLQDALTKTFEGSVKKEAGQELTDQLTTVPKRNLERAEGRGLDPVKTLVDNPAYLPNVRETSTGKFEWDTDSAMQEVRKSISAKEQALQNLLSSQVKQAGKTGKEILGFNINDIRTRTIKDVMGIQGLTGGYTGVRKALNTYFDALEESLQATGGRRYISLNELNDIKRDIREAINFDAVDPFGTIAKKAKADAGSSLMKQVEEAAEKAGIKGVPELNRQMGTELTALNILKSINKKAVKTQKEGLLKSALREIPGSRFVMPKTPSTATSRLKRRRPLRQTARKGLMQVGTGLALSNQQSSEQKQSGTSSR